MIDFNLDGRLSYKQLDPVFDTAFAIIEGLPQQALNQLLQGYLGDMDRLLSEIFRQTSDVLNLNKTLETEKLSYIDGLEKSMDDTLKIQSYNYFKTTMLPNFRQGWRNLEWGNMVQLYPKSAYLAARSHGKCFIRGTRVLMADFTPRAVEDIYPGDEVMGMDFTPRKVLTRHMGASMMYRVDQENGEPYAVNGDHILCLWDSHKHMFREMDVKRFLSLKDPEKYLYGYKVFSYEKPILERSRIKVEPIGKDLYYGFACDGDHKFQLEDGTVVHNSYEFCFAFPLWRLYSYRRPNFMKRQTPDNKNRQETCIITNTETLGKEHMDKIVEEIRTNEFLKAVINPEGKASLGTKSIEGENGTKLHLRGKDGFIRGLHVGAAVSDDLPDESSIYSLEQRQKLEDLFRGSITPIVEPYGYNLVDGCVAPDTLVLTDDGIREIGNLSPVALSSPKGFYPYNGRVFNGIELEPAKAFYINGHTKTRRLILCNGLELETSYVHPILTCGSDGRFTWKKSEACVEGDYVAVKIGAEQWGQPVGVSTEELYQMGVCVADGCLSEDRITIAKKVEGIRRHFIDEQGWHAVGGTHSKIHFRWYKQEKRQLWNSLGYKFGLYNHTKYIPEKVLAGSRDDLRAFLSGYFDGNGCFSGSCGRFHVSCFSVSKKLIQQIQFVLLNMGILSYVQYKKCQSTERVKTDRMGYLLRITNQDMVARFMKEIGFPYSGKADRYVKVETISVMKYGIPHQRELVRKLRKVHSLTEGERAIFGLQKFRMLGKDDVPVYSLNEMRGLSSWIDYCGLMGLSEAQVLQHNARMGYVFFPIRRIEEGENVTVDFSMLETKSFVSNGIVSHNTPYQEGDLYAALKKDKNFKVFEYPAIFPNGRLLAPDRFTFKRLMEERESAGSLVFSREYLVVPISDDSTIFPWEFLKRSIVGMENVRLVENIESYPVKLRRVVCGCDFAESGTVGADFTVYTVWGKGVDDCYYLLYIYRAKGLSHNEQVMKICQIDQQFKPNEIVVEDNGFQKILADMAKQRGLRNIIPFTTTAGNKKDLRTGWPSLAALFERGSIRCPYHPDTRNQVDTMFGEFNSIAFRSDRGVLESISGHDDCVSSSFMAINRLREGATVRIDAV